MSRLIKYPLVNELPILDDFELELILKKYNEETENLERMGIERRYSTPEEKEKHEKLLKEIQKELNKRKNSFNPLIQSSKFLPLILLAGLIYLGVKK